MEEWKEGRKVVGSFSPVFVPAFLLLVSRNCMLVHIFSSLVLHLGLMIILPNPSHYSSVGVCDQRLQLPTRRTQTFSMHIQGHKYVHLSTTSSGSLATASFTLCIPNLHIPTLTPDGRMEQKTLCLDLEFRFRNSFRDRSSTYKHIHTYVRTDSLERRLIRAWSQCAENEVDSQIQ